MDRSIQPVADQIVCQRFAEGFADPVDVVSPFFGEGDFVIGKGVWTRMFKGHTEPLRMLSAGAVNGHRITVPEGRIDQFGLEHLGGRPPTSRYSPGAFPSGKPYIR